MIVIGIERYAVSFTYTFLFKKYKYKHWNIICKYELSIDSYKMCDFNVEGQTIFILFDFERI